MAQRVDSEQRPVWVDVPPAFYRNLKKLAKKYGRTEVEILTEAPDRLETIKSVKVVHPNWKTPTELAELRWSQTTSAQRSAIGKRLALIRWGPKNKRNTKKSKQTA